MIGKTLSQYKILDEVGRGGMGIVYKAIDLKLNREVALKILPPEMISDATRKRRFIQEAQAAAALKHPNIAVVYGIDEDDGTTFIAMELIEGEKLGDILKRGRIEIARAITIAIEVAEGLAKAHEKGVVHRDLKPDNIMITEDGHVKIIDFGLAKLVEPLRQQGSAALTAAKGETQPGQLLGTFSYMSPEQARGQDVDHRSDIFSFGSVLFELLSGEPPFQRKSNAETLGAILRDAAPTLNVADVANLSSLQAILNKCLAKMPEDRYQTVSDLVSDLKDAEGIAKPVHGSVSHSGSAESEMGLTWGKRLAVGFALLVVLVFVFFLGRRGDQEVGGKIPRLANPVQVTSTMGAEEDPAWSPDGRMLAFTAGKVGLRATLMTEVGAADSDIWITSLDGSPAVNRTADYEGQDRFPSWSPDGRQIAFWSGRDGGGYYVMPMLGGSPRKVRSSGVLSNSPGLPQWSQDGSRLACVVYEEGKPFVEIVTLVGNASERFSLPGSSIRRFQLSWSPDGRFFAYVDAGALNDDTSRLLVQRVEDGKAHPITEGLASD